MLLTRFANFLFGGIALGVALFSQDLLKVIFMAHSFYMPVVTVPLFMAITKSLTLTSAQKSTLNIYIGEKEAIDLNKFMNKAEKEHHEKYGHLWRFWK